MFSCLSTAAYLTDVVLLENVGRRLLDGLLPHNLVVPKVVSLSLAQNDEVNVGSGAQVVQDTRLDRLDGQLLGLLNRQVLSEAGFQLAVGGDRAGAHGHEGRVSHAA